MSTTMPDPCAQHRIIGLHPFDTIQGRMPLPGERLARYRSRDWNWKKLGRAGCGSEPKFAERKSFPGIADSASKRGRRLSRKDEEAQRAISLRRRPPHQLERTAR